MATLIGADGKFVSYDGGNSWVPNPSATASTSPAPQTQTQTIPNGYQRISGSDFTGYENVQAVGNPDQGGYWVGYKIPTTTVVNNQGQRVVVRTDGKTGTYPPISQYTSQGYVTESSPGVPSTPFNTSPQGTLQQGAIYADASAPAGWGVDSKGYFVKIPEGYTQQGNQFVPSSGATASSGQTYGGMLTLPNGQRISPDDPNYATYASQMGITQGSSMSAAGPSASDIPGVDTSGWTDSMKQTYQLYQDYVNKLAQQGKIVNPSINITPEMVTRFTDQAKSELGPYYKQVFDQANQDVQLSIDRAKQDLSSRERDIGSSFGKALEGTQTDYARRGLEFSSDRLKAESGVASAAQSALDAAKVAAERGIQNAGIEGERQVGSANLAPLNTSLSLSRAPTSFAPGQYGLTSGGSSTAFTPYGGVTGTQERNQLFDTQRRVTDLTNAERELRTANTI